MNEILQWRVVVNTAAVYLRAYDETNDLVIRHTGENQKWAENHLKEIVKRANKISQKINGQKLPEYLVPTITTAYCAERLTKIDSQFINVINAGITRTERSEL